MRNWKIGLTAVTASLIAGLYWGLHTQRIDWLQAVMIFFSYYGMFVIFVAAVLKPRKFLEDKDYKPYVSILVPARNEDQVIARTIRSLMKIDYIKDGNPNFEVIVMDDNSSDNTFEAARALESEFPNLVVVHRGPDVAGKGKSDVLNNGLRVAKGDLIGVFDADTDAAKDFFNIAVPLLADPKVGGVQGRVRLYNRNKNVLTRFQEDEFAIISHLYQIGKEMVGGLTALGGNGQLVKKEALKDVDGWNYMSPTEDLDLTFRLLEKGWHVRYAGGAVLWQEGVEKPFAFIRQRVRWAEGFLKCIFDYIIPLMFGKSPVMKKVDGVMTLGRVLIPLYLWIIYIHVIISAVKGIELQSGIALPLVYLSTWGFFGALTLGMWKVMYSNIFVAFFRVFLYSFYGAFWIIAIPWGFYNCFKHINDIYWDKTVHTGSSDDTPADSRALQTSETGAVS